MFASIIEKSIENALNKLNFGVVDFVVEHPENEEFGDYSTNAAMVLSKTLKKSPMELAQVIANSVKIRPPILKVEVRNPGFINVWLREESLAEALIKVIIQGDEYGKSKAGKGKNWLIEHTSPNPNKAMHLGHLRNNVFGMALSNIWEFMGIKVIRDCIDNNRGIAIAKLMWGYLKFAKKDENTLSDVTYWRKHKNEWITLKDLKIRPDRFVDDLYFKGSRDFEEFEESEDIVRAMVAKWEQGDMSILELWKTVLEFSYKGQNLTLKRLNSKWDKVWRESDHYKMGKELVLRGVKKRVFKKLDDGAILSNLKKYHLPDTILIKRDGTSLYITQDIALTKLKKETFSPDKMFWVIGPEQGLALKQLFAICEQLGIGKMEEFTHLSYGYMRIKGGARMSSRLGNVVYIDELIDLAKGEVLKKTSDEAIAEKVAVSAVKYSMLKVGRTTNTAFDFEKSLSFEGDSGPYLQYTYARCESVLKKIKKLDKDCGVMKFNEEERRILRHIYKFSEVVGKAGFEYSPNFVALFLFELAKRFNGFYNSHSILEASSENKKQFRGLITKATAQTIKNGILLLGIEPLERM